MCPRVCYNDVDMRNVRAMCLHHAARSIRLFGTQVLHSREIPRSYEPCMDVAKRRFSGDRKRVVWGKRVDLVGHRIIIKKKEKRIAKSMCPRVCYNDMDKRNVTS